MKSEKCHHEDDCWIERTENISGPVAILYEGDGDKVWEFPDSFTDEQIMAALAFANHTFNFGVGIGSHRKAREIRSALEIY